MATGTSRTYIRRLVVVDVEADGNILGEHSMVCFGAALVADPSVTFFGKTRPISDMYDQEALSISGYSREQHLTFDDPKEVMENFNGWLTDNVPGSPVLVSDNNQFDGSWINYYFLKNLGHNPFGWSSRRIGDFWAGHVKDLRTKWKYLRETEHTHDPVDDAKGNAEALMKMLVRSEVIQLKPNDFVKVGEHTFRVVETLNEGCETTSVALCDGLTDRDRLETTAIVPITHVDKLIFNANNKI